LNGWLGRAVRIELEGGSRGISSGERKRRRCVHRRGRQQLQKSWETLRTATPKTSSLATPRILLPTSTLSSTMCLPTNHPFLKPFSSLKKAIKRPRSPMPQSDFTSNDLTRPRSDPPILITPSSTIRAADIAMPVTSQIPSNLPAPKSTSITHQIKFAGDQVEVPGEGVIERLQQVSPTPTGLH
jgi:hypothetical protein